MPGAGHYPVPARETRHEIAVLNSRFIATLAPVSNVDEARAFVERVRAEFPAATHHVPAYLVGYGAAVTAHCSDAGEPSGTAGRPALAVLRGSGLGDVAVVVTRYFGGTKLGTGGLVRAYADAVREVLAVTPRSERVATHTVQIETPYPWFERVRLAVEAHGGVILAEQFGADVRVTARLTVDGLPAFRAALLEMSNGQLDPEVLGTDETTIMPAAQGAAAGG